MSDPWHGWNSPVGHPVSTSFTAEGPDARAMLQDWLKSQEREKELQAARARIAELEAELAALRKGES